LQDPVAFDRDVYSRLTIIDKFKHVKVAIRSIINTLNPASEYLPKIDILYIGKLRVEISEYFKMFDSVVGAFPEYELCSEEIEFIENNCKDTSCVHEELERAIRWLLVAHDALETTEEEKRNAGRFDTQLREEYYRRLQNCRNALITAIGNLKNVT
jgi:hypothetical protein